MRKPRRRQCEVVLLLLAWVALAVPAAAAAIERCGPNVCLGADRCCNESCGICAPPGGACIQPHCGWERDQAGGLRPIFDPRAPNPMPSHALTAIGAWMPAQGGRDPALAYDLIGTWAPLTWLSLQGGMHDRDAIAAATSALWAAALLHLPTFSPRVHLAIGPRFRLTANADTLRAPGTPAPRLEAANPAHHGLDLVASAVYGMGLFGVAAHGSAGVDLATDAGRGAWLVFGSLTASVVLPDWMVPLGLRLSAFAGNSRGRADATPLQRFGGEVALGWHHGPWMLGVLGGWGRQDAFTVARAPMAGVFVRFR